MQGVYHVGNCDHAKSNRSRRLPVGSEVEQYRVCQEASWRATDIDNQPHKGGGVRRVPVPCFLAPQLPLCGIVALGLLDPWVGIAAGQFRLK